MLCRDINILHIQCMVTFPPWFGDLVIIYILCGYRPSWCRQIIHTHSREINVFSNAAVFMHCIDSRLLKVKLISKNRIVHLQKFMAQYVWGALWEISPTAKKRTKKDPIMFEPIFICKGNRLSRYAHTLAYFRDVFRRRLNSRPCWNHIDFTVTLQKSI